MTDYWCFKCSCKSKLPEYGPCPLCKSQVMEEYSPASQAFIPYQIGQSETRPSVRPQLIPFFGGMMPQISTFTRNFMAFNGDYIQRIQQNLLNLLSRNSHRLAGNPPASQRAIDSLREKQQGQCGVCGQQGGKGLVLPCQHFFHKQCILRWLSMKNTCPICRYQLQSCDPNYELKRQSNSHP